MSSQFEFETLYERASPQARKAARGVFDAEVRVVHKRARLPNHEGGQVTAGLLAGEGFAAHTLDLHAWAEREARRANNATLAAVLGTVAALVVGSFLGRAFARRSPPSGAAAPSRT